MGHGRRQCHEITPAIDWDCLNFEHTNELRTDPAMATQALSAIFIVVVCQSGRESRCGSGFTIQSALKGLIPAGKG